MRKIVHLVIVLALSLVMLGCESDGNLDISNETEGWLDLYVEGDLTSLNAYEAVEYSWTIPFLEEQDVNIEADGLYVLDYQEDMIIIGGDNEDLQIEANAAVIRIDNNTNIYIWELYISPDESLYWNEDVLGTDVLAPGNYVEYTVSPGAWDVKLVDSNGYEYVLFYSQDIDYLYAGDMQEINFSNKKSLKKSYSEKSEGLDPNQSNYKVKKRH